MDFVLQIARACRVSRRCGVSTTRSSTPSRARCHVTTPTTRVASSSTSRASCRPPPPSVPGCRSSSPASGSTNRQVRCCYRVRTQTILVSGPSAVALNEDRQLVSPSLDVIYPKSKLQQDANNLKIITYLHNSLVRRVLLDGNLTLTTKVSIVAVSPVCERIRTSFEPLGTGP